MMTVCNLRTVYRWLDTRSPSYPSFQWSRSNGAQYAKVYVRRGVIQFKQWPKPLDRMLYHRLFFTTLSMLGWYIADEF